MNDTTQKLLQKADRAINAGTNALAGGHVESAAGRAYYAMFYVAEALLNERGNRHPTRHNSPAGLQDRSEPRNENPL